MRALIGRTVLVAHNTDPIGWHIAHVRFFGVSASWRKVCPTANFVLRYTKKETNGEFKDGSEEVGAVLGPRFHGNLQMGGSAGA